MRNICICALLLCNICVFAQKPTIAIYAQVDNGESISTLSLTMSKTFLNDYEISSRSDMLQEIIDREVKYQYSGKVDEKELVRLGKQYGADNICVISVTYEDSLKMHYIESRIISTEQSKLMAIADYMCENLSVDSQKKAALHLVDELYGNAMSDSSSRKYKVLLGKGTVDLDLPSGTIWAQYNIGANDPEQVGGYYAWGCVEEQEKYKPSKCWAYGAILPRFNKISHDVAYREWGALWEIPSSENVEELINNCNWIYKKDGIVGISKINGAMIFFPITGAMSYEDLKESNIYGLYWTTCIDNSEFYSWAMGFNIQNKFLHLTRQHRYFGLPVRPICKIKKR